MALSNPDELKKRNVRVMPIKKQDYWAREEQVAHSWKELSLEPGQEIDCVRPA